MSDPIVRIAFEEFQKRQRLTRKPEEPEEIIAWQLAKFWLQGFEAGKKASERAAVLTPEDLWRQFLPYASQMWEALQRSDEHTTI